MLRRFVMDSHLIGEVQLYSLASLVRRALSGGLEVSDLFVAEQKTLCMQTGLQIGKSRGLLNVGVRSNQSRGQKS
jgi:hypothetical protein